MNKQIQVDIIDQDLQDYKNELLLLKLEDEDNEEKITDQIKLIKELEIKLTKI